jgi:hypothetical protein
MPQVDQVDQDVDAAAGAEPARGAGPGRVRRLRRVASDAGMTTAEYAVGTVAACGFAGVLYKLLTSSTVVSLLTGIVKRALATGV